MSTAGFAASGSPLPWAYTRRDLARQWGVPPWEVDAAPNDEVETELAIRRIEAECAPRKGGR